MNGDRAGPDAPAGAETALDAAFLRAHGGAAPEPAMAAFYDALLAATLYLPLEHADDPEDAAPMAVELDGAPTLLVFDREDRLAEFLERPSAYAAAPGDAVLRMAAAAGAQIGVNLGPCPSATLLPAEVVRWIAGRAAEPVETLDLGAAALTLSPPAGIGQNLLAALSARIADLAAAIVEAWLLTARVEATGAEHLALAVLPAPRAPIDRAALAETLARAAQPALPPGRPLDIAFLAEGEAALGAARRIGVGLHGAPAERPAREAPGADPARPPKLR